MNREQYLNKMRAHTQPKAGVLKVASENAVSGKLPHPASAAVSRPEHKVKKVSKVVALVA